MVVLLQLSTHVHVAAKAPYVRGLACDLHAPLASCGQPVTLLSLVMTIPACQARRAAPCRAAGVGTQQRGEVGHTLPHQHYCGGSLHSTAVRLYTRTMVRRRGWNAALLCVLYVGA